jgi:fucose permease
MTTTHAEGLSRSQVAAWRNALFVIFAVCGLAMASWAARLPAISEILGASTLDIGVLIFGLSAGSIVGLLASSHVISRLGSSRTIQIAFLVGPVGFLVAGVGVGIASFGVVFTGLLVFGVAFSICDVSMNLQGAANERALGRTIMPIYHAFFSGGTMAGAGLGAVAEGAGFPVWLHILVVGVVMLVAAQLVVRFLHSEHTGHAPAGQGEPSRGTWRDRLAIWRDPGTLLIGLIVLGMAFAEGSANDWLAVASVQGHGVDKTVGALVFGVFVTSMTVGRLVGVLLLDRFGRVPVLRASTVLAVIGLASFIFVPNPVVATIGVVLWGLGASLGFPVGMSAAADDPKTGVARVSTVATIGYFAFLIGPPVIGWIGEHAGILSGLIPVLVLVAVSGLASGAARERRPDADEPVADEVRPTS